jgi:hypothetical protein
MNPKMSTSRSIHSLASVGLAFVCAVAAWALIEAVDEGDEIRLAMGNSVSVFVLFVVVPASVFWFLNTWFVPSAFTIIAITIFRALRTILGIGMFAAIIGLLGFFAAVGIGSENTASMAVAVFCLSLAMYGFWFACLAVLAGGFIGIVIDLCVVASRIRLPKAKC